MDIRYFLHFLWRKRWIILGISVLSAVTAFILIGRLPEKFTSNAILSTGIIEFKGAKLSQDNPFYQQFQVDNAFDNLMEGIQSRSSLHLLTRRLLAHDLRTDSEETPFRKALEISDNVDPEQYARLVKQPDFPAFILQDSLNEEEKITFNQLAKAFEYDYAALRENMTVNRIGKTDYLKIEFTSENPELSHFAVKSFCEEIVKLDRETQNSEENTTVDFFNSLVKEKKLELDTLTKRLNYYNANQNLVNLEEQAKSTVSQIRELELLREKYNKDIPALEANIANLNHYIKQTARINADNYASSIFLNEDVKEISDQIIRLKEAFISSGQTDAALEQQITSLREQREKLINRVANNQTKDADEVVKRNRELLDKRLEKELELNTAKEGVESLDKEITRLKARQKSLVSNEAYVGNLEQQIEIVRKEYFDLVNKLQEAEQLSRKKDTRLSILEPAQVPDKPEPNHQGLIAAFSGVSSGLLATLFLFVIAFFDQTVSTPMRLKRNTGLPVTCYVNRLKFKGFDFNTLFTGQVIGEESQFFLESIRKLRYDIEASGGKTILFTSLQPGEGKSFIALALAYAFSLSQKKILIIDTNFRHNSLSLYGTTEEEDNIFEQSITQSQNTASPLPAVAGYLPKTVEVMPNFGGHLSPNEAFAGKDIIKLLYQYQQQFDYVFLEGSALNQFADTRELAVYADKVFGVFSAKSSIENKDMEGLTFLKSLGQKYQGSILNKTRAGTL
jgi:succinoglycan biosynthesis transport protein ExoP